MTIRLVVNTQTPPLSWKSTSEGPGFIDLYEPYAIALDGFVKEGPRFTQNPDGPYANFNHHEDVDRLATRSTCAQVLMAIRQGLFRTFRDENGPRITAYVNDCDEDVCLAWFLLKHGFLAEQAMNPMLNRLVDMEDNLDATAGAYPYPKDLPALMELAWVFEPYRRFRLSGEIDKKDPKAYRAVILDCEHRIMQHITGKGDSIPLDTRYENVHPGKGWAMIKEIGAQARTGAHSDGIYAYVAIRSRGFVKVHPDHAGGTIRWTYTVGRMSPFINFDVPKLLKALSVAEAQAIGKEAGPANNWGGGDTIGGSPRGPGSVLSPTQVTQVVEEVINGR
jgi:hypothetical protein